MRFADPRERVLALLAAVTEPNRFGQYAEAWMMLSVLEDTLSIWREQVKRGGRAQPGNQFTLENTGFFIGMF
jgi:hypothetical protein